MLKIGLRERRKPPNLRTSLWAVALASLFFAPAAAADEEFAVGFSRLSIADPMGGKMQVSLWYPTDVANGLVRLGPFEFPGTRDAEPAAGDFGLVVLSHGTGGSDLGHRDTAIALAKAGFFAAAPLHPRDNFRVGSGSARRVVWEGRPRQLSAVIDALLDHEDWSRRIDARRIGAFGFSLGGYTVLALLGAEADLSLAIDHCSQNSDDDPFCSVGQRPQSDGSGTAEGFAGSLQSLHDKRICAAVIADPVAVVFSDATLKAIPPVQALFYRPEIENVLTARFHVSHVLDALRERSDFPDPQEVVVPRAHHYSFIAPFPEVVAMGLPEIASDPEGFDRAGFHEAMNRSIVAFFEQALSDCVAR